MLITLLTSLTMSQTHFMEVLILVLMNSTRSMPFPLGIHLIQGLAILPDHLSDPNLNNQGPISHFKSIVALSIFHLKSIILESGCNESLKAYNTEAINRFDQRKVHNTEVVEIPQDDPPEPPVPDNGPFDLPESDLDIPDDPILDFVNSQCHNSEDLDQALQAYQAYQVPCPQYSTEIPDRTINNHCTYHVAQTAQV